MHLEHSVDRDCLYLAGNWKFRFCMKRNYRHVEPITHKWHYAIISFLSLCPLHCT